MKAIILFLSVLGLGVQNAMADSCNIEEGYYLKSFNDQIMIKVDSCEFKNPNWGQNHYYTAKFNKIDLNRAKREILSKHRHLIADRCPLLGTGEIEISSYNGKCNSETSQEVTADFTLKYKCHLY